MVIGPRWPLGDSHQMTKGIATNAERPSGDRAVHANAFGFLRLFFASLVIVSHTPEMLDADRGRELLTLLFGTISFGELAVDAFFLISGFLIVGSFVKRPEIMPYLRNRVARIYPGFIVASLVTLLIAAPLGGATAQGLLDTAARSALKIVVLDDPWEPGAFTTNPLTTLNGPMWTIAYEFRCYLLVIALGLAGVFRYPALVAALAVACLCTAEFTPRAVDAWMDEVFPYSTSVFGDMVQTLRLTGLFLAGAVFYLKREAIRFTIRGIVIAAAGLIVCLCFTHLAEPGVAVFGGYLIFAVAAWGGRGVLARINNGTDISYGVYLYAWPAAQLLIYHNPDIGVWELGPLTFAIAGLCGWISWHVIEKPMMRRFRGPVRWRSSPRPVGASVASGA